ncbi:hypothetical protein BBK82_30520 [Lentzea guizhouensis]|uniref:GNAT family N-acetyltransferase n=1 Tax=Lentzea guizhouensis TaxID=1586287 RepID=A0A1B2HPS9_9PSEU|nr:GNAT family N-acetyltransferase [Lentzea guizhouensis]ANZ39734.1 hypothetical protein BBK82_30520 [Lentzea guizhouensis]
MSEQIIPGVLVRLYDLPASAPASLAGTGEWRARTVPPSEQAALPFDWSVLGPATTPASLFPDSELLLFEAGDKPVASAALNTSGRGVVGPIRFDPAADPRLLGEVLHAALWRIRWRGYAYGFLDTAMVQLAADELRTAFWELPDPRERLGAAERDDPSLEWGDILVDLRGTSLPVPVVDLELDGFPVQVRRPEAAEQLLLVEWIRDEYGLGWASEMQRAFANDPVSGVIVARRGFSQDPRECLLGFVGYNTVRTGMLSSIALSPVVRGRHPMITASLLKLCLSEARASGFDHVVLGGVSRRQAALIGIPAAWTIPGSYPGIFGKSVRG